MITYNSTTLFGLQRIAGLYYENDNLQIDNYHNVNIVGSDLLFLQSLYIGLDSSGTLLLNAADYVRIVAPYIYMPPLKNTELNTTQILALPTFYGMQVFNTTINQMVYFQNSPITGLIAGWYNATGTIKL